MPKIEDFPKRSRKHPGFRINPKAKLDPSQVEDFREYGANMDWYDNLQKHVRTARRGVGRAMLNAKYSTSLTGLGSTRSMRRRSRYSKKRGTV